MQAGKDTNRKPVLPVTGGNHIACLEKQLPTASKPLRPTGELSSTFWSLGTIYLYRTDLPFSSYRALWEKTGRIFKESFRTHQQRSAVR